MFCRAKFREDQLELEAPQRSDAGFYVCVVEKASGVRLSAEVKLGKTRPFRTF